MAPQSLWHLEIRTDARSGAEHSAQPSSSLFVLLNFLILPQSLEISRTNYLSNGLGFPIKICANAEPKNLSQTQLLPQRFSYG